MLGGFPRDLFFPLKEPTIKGYDVNEAPGKFVLNTPLDHVLKSAFVKLQEAINAKEKTSLEM